MGKTAVADIIIPTEFEKYAIERTAELSAFGQSGIVESAPEFDDLAMGGGREVKMPFWKDLSGARQLLSDSASLTVNKITSDQDIARIHNDAQVWSVNHLAKVVSGDDPMGAIVDLVAGYWARPDERLVGHCGGRPAWPGAEDARTIVGWNGAFVPAGLSNVTAIAAGRAHRL